MEINEKDVASADPIFLFFYVFFSLILTEKNVPMFTVPNTDHISEHSDPVVFSSVATSSECSEKISFLQTLHYISVSVYFQF